MPELRRIRELWGGPKGDELRDLIRQINGPAMEARRKREAEERERQDREHVPDLPPATSTSVYNRGDICFLLTAYPMKHL